MEDRMWFKDFMNLYFENPEASYRLKQEKMPTKLYKFQPISDSIREQRLKTVKENKLWVCNSLYLNDPYDCNAFYYLEDEIRQMIKYHIGKNPILTSVDDKMKEVESLLFGFRSNLEIACFSEELYNMPLWGNYADNHRGICIEYDFSKIPSNNDFSKMLFPVGYDEKRYNITNLLMSLVNNDKKSNPYILFFLILMKHCSWEYEQEWRFINFNYDKTQRRGTVIDIPVKPTAIYFGLNCSSDDIEEISSLVDTNETSLYKLKTQNGEFFDLGIL
ncbi:DUF2971 domain-containing protein [Lysinibacillus pakistanensis]|uniref:DUF2971 domain-containing protein n=1 Tax=Lysinibacillus pakistanensis TaxID=759811 RepID=UPI003D2E5A9B